MYVCMYVCISPQRPMLQLPQTKVKSALSNVLHLRMRGPGTIFQQPEVS